MDFFISPQGIEILVIALVLSIASSLITKYTMGKEAKEARAKQKLLSEEFKVASKAKDTKKMQSLQSEIMKSSLSSMRFSLKPMLITFIPFILVFGWMSGNYGGIGTVNFEMDVSNPDLAFFNCPSQTNSNQPHYCNSSHFNGTLTGGQTLDFSMMVIVIPNQTEYKTKININGLAKDTKGKDYILSAETVTVSTGGEPEKNPYYQKENKDVEITPKFLSNQATGAHTTYAFKLTNHLAGNVVTLFGFELSWLVWYILIMLPASFIIGRLLKLY